MATEVIKLMNDAFDVHSEEYDNWYEKNKFVYLSEVEALKRVVPEGGKGIEIGVGTGRFALPLGVTIGIDPSEKMLKIARERGIRTFVARGENLPFGDSEFDYVLIVISICFVDNPEQVISESRRVLKENGKLIIGIVDKNSQLGRFYEEKKRRGSIFYEKATFFSTDEIIEMMKKNGFTGFITYQTIFKPLDEIKEIEEVEEGYGRGGFVVICGRKHP